MKTSNCAWDELSEFKLNSDMMNKLRGGDGPIPPPNPPGEPIGK